MAGEGWVFGEGLEGGMEGGGLGGVAEEAVATGLDPFGGADVLANDDGQFGGHGFGDDEAEGIVVGGIDEDVGGVVGAGGLGFVAVEADARGDAKAVGEVAVGVELGAGDDEEFGVGKGGELFEGFAEAFDGFADEEPGPGVGCEIEVRAFGGAFGWVGGGAEAVGVGAVINDAGGAVPVVVGADFVGEDAGDGDEMAGAGLLEKEAFERDDDEGEEALAQGGGGRRGYLAALHMWPVMRSAFQQVRPWAWMRS